MQQHPYLVVTGTIFGLVALVHLLRVVNGWSFEIGPWSLPMAASWIGTLVPAILCVWAFRLARDRGG